MKPSIVLAAFALLSLTFASCTQTQKGVATGAAAGAASGAVAAGDGKRGTGALIGGAVGGVTGGVIGNTQEQQQYYGPAAY